MISIPEINFADISAVSKADESENKYKSFKLYRSPEMEPKNKIIDKSDKKFSPDLFAKDGKYKELFGEKDDLADLFQDEFTTQDPEALYKEAVQYFDKNDYHQAKYLLDEVLLYDSKNAKAYLMKADILANTERYQEAIDEIKKILEFDNLYVEAYYLLGVLYCKIEDFKSAERKFRKVLYIDPYLCLAYFNLTNIYIYQKSVHKAKKELNNLIKILENQPKEEIVKMSGDLSVGLLLRVCRNTFSTLKK